MWIFGQVWFACLVGFAVGVLLDWVVRVRPLSNRVAELEARLAADARSARSDGEYGRSVFDRGPFSAANSSPDGFITERNRGGLLTPGGLATDLLDPGEPEPAPPGDTRSGVEDFPGVARLSEAWDEAEEATRNAPEPWQPIGPAAAAAEEEWRDSPAPAEPEPWLPSGLSGPSGSEEPTQVSSWMTERPADAAEPDQSDADDQYLEFLRAGANHAPAEPGMDDEAELAGQDAGASDVTSVMPQVEGYEAYESYADEYEQNGYQRNGYREEAVDQPEYEETNGFQFADYQPEEVDEPAESSSPLPRRRSGESLRFAPFEIPFEAQEAGAADVQPQRGEMTPIQEGGFQPFSKPSDVVSADTATDGAWLGDDGQLVGGYEGHQVANGSHSLMEQQQPMDEAGSSWFDLSQTNPQSSAGGGEGGLTQRMLPVSRPDLDHPDLLRESVFGTETDTQYANEDRERSLFEPVVEADELEDTYQAPAYEGQPQQYENEYQPFEGQPFQDQPFQDQPFEDRPFEDQQQYGEPQFQEQPFQGQNFDDQPFESQNFAGQNFDQPADYDATANALETTGELPTTDPATGDPVSGEYYDQTQPPRPIRVRTGVDGPVTQIIPAIHPTEDQGSGHQEGAGEPGPFGPGSALPHPDGSAPTDGFTVKARTSSMVFHTQSSPFFDRLEPQVWFRTPEDAQRAGFTSWERPRSW
jgi:hypothetical protein